MNILGVHFALRVNDHDPGAALVKGGELICVAEEERFSRVKLSRASLPLRAIRQCLDQGNLTIRDIDCIVTPGDTDPSATARITAILEHYFGYAPPVTAINHQIAHLSSAYYCSGLDEAMVISYDGSGDSLSCSLARGSATGIEVLETYPATNSLGNFYEMITQFLGFAPAEGEYKVMGLAPYGKPGIDLSDMLKTTSSGYSYNNDGCYKNEYPFTLIEVPFYSDLVSGALGAPRRVGESISQRHMDIASAAQKALESAVIQLVTHLHELTGLNALCLAGGVALNCSANMKLAQLPFIQKLFVQPAASDRGLALGCALWGAARVGVSVVMTDVFRCGPAYSDDAIEAALEMSGYRYQRVSDPARAAAEKIHEGKIVGWFQGRSEFGPRALGHRSILANPKVADIKDKINARVKFREEFRPFAPSVVEERARDYFDMGILKDSPYMTVAVPVLEARAHEIPGVTHVNLTARVQTVSKVTDPLFHHLISEFGVLSGTPVVVNTSFNIRGQPIVETPLDAIGTFAGCGLDAMFLGHYMVAK